MSDPIRLLEALYDLERPRDVWFQGVLEAAGRELDQGAGVGMVLYDVSGPALHVEALAGFNLTDAHVQLGKEMHTVPGWEEEIVAAYRSVVCATLDEHVPNPQIRITLRERYLAAGIRDQVIINGSNVAGPGCALYLFSSKPVRLSASNRLRLSRIATHLSTSYRLHRRLEQSSPGDVSGVEAVLGLDGKVTHAESSARSTASRGALETAVLQREWALSSAGRSHPDHATAAWKPLVAGQWSLIDCYEQCGRRYITARENAPVRVGLDVLSSRERQVASLAGLGRSNKVIAYELGLAHSTVRVLLARAAYKLGFRTRSQLIAGLRLLQKGGDT